MTDGEASHPGSRQMPPPVLARRRREELSEALDLLGVDRHRRHRLGLPDTEVAMHEPALAQWIGELLRTSGATLCVGPWRGDLHADHEAVGRAGRTAAGRIVFWQYPVWMWHWAVPGSPQVPWQLCRRLSLAPAELALKKSALRRFGTQIAPLADHPTLILPPEELAHHQRSFETVIVETEPP
ncbi:PIG-L family deacetylase [Streptomyces sp. NPDC048301]|uniref:PIG-L deacetylase family protein n=1 Tax=Streptomyces sp. NPDC048301 TaxID=3155631 RepID=UPI0034165B56